MRAEERPRKIQHNFYAVAFDKAVVMEIWDDSSAGRERKGNKKIESQRIKIFNTLLLALGNSGGFKRLSSVSYKLVNRYSYRNRFKMSVSTDKTYLFLIFLLFFILFISV